MRAATLAALLLAAAALTATVQVGVVGGCM